MVLRYMFRQAITSGQARRASFTGLTAQHSILRLPDRTDEFGHITHETRIRPSGVLEFKQEPEFLIAIVPHWLCLNSRVPTLRRRKYRGFPDFWLNFGLVSAERRLEGMDGAENYEATSAGQSKNCNCWNA
jgi:hypothetical protein